MSLQHVCQIKSLTNQVYIFSYGGTTGGRVRSLLPAHADDAESLYSEDEEVVPGYQVRPQYRAETEPRRTISQSVPHGDAGYNHIQAVPQIPFGNRTSQDELHGTNKSINGPMATMSSHGRTLSQGHLASQSGHFNSGMEMEPEPEPIPVADESTADENESNGGTLNKKKKGKFSRFFK